MIKISAIEKTRLKACDDSEILELSTITAEMEKNTSKPLENFLTPFD